MFGISMPEMLLILAVALIVIGPKKLPDLARSLGRALGEFKKATSDFKNSLDVDPQMNDVRKAFQELNRDVRDAVNTPAAPASPASEKESPAAPETAGQPSATKAAPVSTPDGTSGNA
jgi:TatA/E family protein of Tat protein translocase